VLAATPDVPREEQTAAISRSVLKYVRDKALRLMLPEPKGTYDTVGDKVCQELVHFDFADLKRGKGYELTTQGKKILGLLNDKKYLELRRKMALIHIKTYANLQAIVHWHIIWGGIMNPTVETAKTIDVPYVAALLTPTFASSAVGEAEAFLTQTEEKSPKKIEDALRNKILKVRIPVYSIGVPLFRAITDRLISLRLLNAMKISHDHVEFYRTYSPCLEARPVRKWHCPSRTPLSSGGQYEIFLSEPDFSDEETRNSLSH